MAKVVAGRARSARAQTVIQAMPPARRRTILGGISTIAAAETSSPGGGTAPTRRMA
ncbi:hypothetical protein [Oleomonas cavernae]|uniref:hypothetical protein n=1 Tax=Oleomonas cavernae TaxID=2320859 RepID=UPI001314D135|nr:hypothetical protein [Oleomonas cavernae]